MKAVNDVVEGNDTLRNAKEWVYANPQKAAIAAVIAVAVIVALIIIIIVISRSSSTSDGGTGTSSFSPTSSHMPLLTLSPSRMTSYNSSLSPSPMTMANSTSPSSRYTNSSSRYSNNSSPTSSPSTYSPSPAVSGQTNSSGGSYWGAHDYYNVCNMRGMMFPDSNGTCECFMDCFTGTYCERTTSNCTVYTKNEQGLGLFADYWTNLNSKGGSANGGLDPLIIAPEYRLPYQDDMRAITATSPNGLSRALYKQITMLHQTYGNSNINNKVIILGTSRNGLMQAALFAIWKISGSSQPVSFFSRTPYNRDYPRLCQYSPGICTWAGSVSSNSSSSLNSSKAMFEIISKPQNPTGQRPTLGQVYPSNPYWGYDLPDYWPSLASYGGALLTSDAPVQFYSLSKLSGHGSGRFAWAIVDSSFSQMSGYMRDYISNIQIHLGLETATRALQIITFLNSNPTIFNTTSSTITRRWMDVVKMFNSSAVQNAGWMLNSTVGSQFLWIGCPTTYDESTCTRAFEGNMLIGYPGRDFGATTSPFYYRLSITVRESIYPFLMQNLAKVVGGTYTSSMMTNSTMSSR